MRHRKETGTGGFTNLVCGAMKRYGAKVVPYVADGRSGTSGEGGIPDRLVIWKGITWWFEFKGYETPVQPRQRWQLNELRKRSPYVWILRDGDDTGELTRVEPQWIDGTSLGIMKSIEELWEALYVDAGLEVSDLPWHT